MGTHINAFQAEVDEKKQALDVAQNAYDQAEAALKAHPDYKKSAVPKPEVEPVAKVVKSQETASKSKSKK